MKSMSSIVRKMPPHPDVFPNSQEAGEKRLLRADRAPQKKYVAREPNTRLFANEKKIPLSRNTRHYKNAHRTSAVIYPMANNRVPHGLSFGTLLLNTGLHHLHQREHDSEGKPKTIRLGAPHRVFHKHLCTTQYKLAIADSPP